MKKRVLTGSAGVQVVALFLSVLTGMAQAAGPGQGGARGGRGFNHDMASSLHQSGDIQSLEQLLQGVDEEHQGRVLEAELEEEQGRYVYEVELLDQQGRLRKLHFDARSGERLDERR